MVNKNLAQEFFSRKANDRLPKKILDAKFRGELRKDILERKSEEKVETRISMVQLNGQREKQNIKLSIYSLVNF
ncbi:hypothetical protein [Methanothrix soehngenii]|uniref:hypothetical protein n=1 Tax=Methanothrix soehngenii TaxID=2223 RepID=UPI00300C38F9